MVRTVGSIALLLMQGALDLSRKTAAQACTPLDKVNTHDCRSQTLVCCNALRGAITMKRTGDVALQTR